MNEEKRRLRAPLFWSWEMAENGGKRAPWLIDERYFRGV